MFLNQDKSEDGFTLIELLVVVIIIGILAAIAIPAFLGFQANAREARTESDVRNSVSEVAAASVETGNPPSVADANKVLVDSDGNGTGTTVYSLTADGKNYEILGTNQDGYTFKYTSADGKFASSKNAGGTGGGETLDLATPFLLSGGSLTEADNGGWYIGSMFASPDSEKGWPYFVGPKESRDEGPYVSTGDTAKYLPIVASHYNDYLDHEFSGPFLASNIRFYIDGKLQSVSGDTANLRVSVSPSGIEISKQRYALGDPWGANGSLPGIIVGDGSRETMVKLLTEGTIVFDAKDTKDNVLRLNSSSVS